MPEDSFIKWPLRTIICPQCGATYETRDIRQIYCTRRCTRRASDKRVKERTGKHQLKIRLESIQQSIERNKLDLNTIDVTKLEQITPEPRERKALEDDEQNPFAMLERILGRPKADEEQTS